ncbi:hypothetical protein AMECASPLE_017928 [Ameca splendens]|uniref:Uncharacterized protein n=1 Tax=Ameca splendens TaxID=208324 RepID=A0ABV0ZMY7_9TELE
MTRTHSHTVERRTVRETRVERRGEAEQRGKRSERDQRRNARWTDGFYSPRAIRAFVRQHGLHRIPDDHEGRGWTDRRQVCEQNKIPLDVFLPTWMTPDMQPTCALLCDRQGETGWRETSALTPC